MKYTAAEQTAAIWQARITISQMVRMKRVAFTDGQQHERAVLNLAANILRDSEALQEAVEAFIWGAETMSDTEELRKRHHQVAEELSDQYGIRVPDIAAVISFRQKESEAA